MRLADGELTTIYAVRHAGARVRVIHFGARPRRLDVWCRSHGVEEAVVGGFFLRDPYRALGALRVGGRAVAFEPVDEPWGERRACVWSDGTEVRLGSLAALPAGGDLVQAGPLLVAGGEVVFDPGRDDEGFSRGAAQFDSDITDGRHPRAALGVTADGLVVVACDGRRSGVDAGLTMAELASVLAELGAVDAINLDGGGSATLVHRGHLLNRPYSSQDQPAPRSRPVVSALAFE